MKRLWLIFLLIIAISSDLFASRRGNPFAKYETMPAVLKEIKGGVYLVQDTKVIPLQDTGSFIIKRLDSIYVSDTGMATLYLPTIRLYIYMDTRTRITFYSTPQSHKDWIFFYMKFGNAWFKMKRSILGPNYLVRTFYADFWPVSLNYHIYSDHQRTRVTVFQGNGIFGVKKDEETICNITRGKYAEVYSGKLIYPKKLSQRLIRFFHNFKRKFDIKD